ncbi:type I 3-dehydroquinate dehydratase [Halapricum hydrolyticum]|uniref:3-dehydroquinate dehydratase n=1 Tax=Halapricum hydrolyticum TaxID=2979991 RepID=A0AAE3LHL0_9EURY|nr:type I 3-dehydroquinate dehydratase [Halapricum hydrolyticum]MCU4717840.1 type I 3-dehydroquinate dehydratase [Halapricum hydrolyticum]MCU4727004.1 type I 3-dehydroquinate dehydratase [Halapricum hydrolyticum]
MDFDSFVLAASTADLADESDAREHADCLEFRMDLADAPLDALASYDGDLPILATNRAAWEGGEASDDRNRLDALAAAVEHDAVEAVDVELETMRSGDGQRVVEHAREHGADVVVSSHDFEDTPGMTDLQETLREACGYGDVGKLAVTAQARADVLDLLVATRAATAEGDRVATMAMGEPGRHSRAVAPLYGSRIGYAPVDPAEATAPGQYDLATLRGLVETLAGEGNSVNTPGR